MSNLQSQLGQYRIELEARILPSLERNNKGRKTNTHTVSPPNSAGRTQILRCCLLGGKTKMILFMEGREYCERHFSLVGCQKFKKLVLQGH